MAHTLVQLFIAGVCSSIACAILKNPQSKFEKVLQHIAYLLMIISLWFMVIVGVFGPLSGINL